MLENAAHLRAKMGEEAFLWPSPATAVPTTGGAGSPAAGMPAAANGVDSTTTYLLCVENDGYPVALEPRKVYAQIPDAAAERDGLVRVIDESGEDYLFPARLFARISVPAEAERAFSAA